MLKTPFFIIGFDLKKVFSVEDGQGVRTLPVFTVIELAEKYRRYFARKHKLKLRTYITDSAEKGLNLVECAAMACPELKFIAIDPPPPTSKLPPVPLIGLSSALKTLMGQYHRKRKPRNRQGPHKK
jgi:hypothetical protein